METSKAGHLMSLAALQRQDPYINKLLDVTGQVALYNFNSKANEWEKTEIEGTLFVYARSASPHHGFTIMNRLSTENLVEPINKDLEFQLQDPFLLYRNANLGIYSIWFYDKKDCQRIAQLMVKIVKQEADYAHSTVTPVAAGPGKTNGVAEPRTIDILELLSKAKEEYHRTQPGETNMSAAPETSTTPAVNSSQHEHGTTQAEKSSSHTMVKQITVEELFGSPLPRDPALPSMPAQSAAAAAAPCEPSNPGLSASPYLQARPYAPPEPLHPPRLGAPDPGPAPHQLAPSLLPAPASYGLQPGPALQAAGPSGSDPQPRCPVSPLVLRPVGPDPRAAVPSSSTQAFLGQDILGTLGAAVPSGNADIHSKPTLAPSFLPSTLVPPHSFQEPIGKPQDAFSHAQNLRKPMAGLAVSSVGPGLSVLLSPSAFQHSAAKAAAEPPRLVTAPAVVAGPSAGPPATSDLSPAAADPHQSACSKAQLQEALIHLIKNDPAFLGTIHDAYLHSLSKDFAHMTL